MKMKGGLTPARALTYFVLFLALTCFGLNLAERAENHLLGLDKPAASVGLTCIGNYEYYVYLLGTAYTVDLDDEVRSVRETFDALSREVRTRLDLLKPGGILR
ncbi:MAG: hypothetical protein AB1774_01180 [Bacillota bacterium]